MSRSYSFLAILPLFAVMSLSPMELHTKASRGLASVEEVVSVTPKLAARKAKIDRSQFRVFEENGMVELVKKRDALKVSLEKQKADFKSDLKESKEIEAQKLAVESLVKELIAIEEDAKAVKEKTLLTGEDDAIHSKIMAEYEASLESLISDEEKLDLAQVKVEEPKKEPEVVAEVKPEAKPEVKVEVKTETVAELDKAVKLDDQLCKLEEKNTALTKQVTDLMDQQKVILENLTNISALMVQLNHNMQQQQPQAQASNQMPDWLMYTLLSRNQSFPTLQQPWIYAPQQPNYLMNYSQPQLGSQTYQQSIQSGPYQLPVQQAQPFYNPYSVPATFGSNSMGPLAFNFQGV